MRRTKTCALLAGLGCAAVPAHAQWSSQADEHLVVADGPGEQVQPKIVATSDGGCYVSWFSSDSGYDVRLQRLDALGNEMWARNGVLVADRGFSSTQDYDLGVDDADHALLVFRDDRFGGTRITAQRVAPDGTLAWGADGVQFGNGTDFVASPDLAATSDGAIVVGWVNNADSHLQRLDADGNTLWPAAVVVTDGSGGTIGIASMHRSDAGSVIVSWVRGGGFTTPRHLYAQKFDASGSPAWGAPVAVFDGGSLQFGNFPEFDPDDAGGAVFSWYDTASGLDVFVQRVLADGTEAFAHNGVRASSDAGEQRVDPRAIFVPGTGDTSTDSICVVWTELRDNQGRQGIFAQRLDAAGNRLWSGPGVALAPVDDDAKGLARLHRIGDDVMFLWIQTTGGFGNDRVLARALGPNGDPAWQAGTTEVTSDFAQRSRLTSALGADGFVIAGWQVGDFGVADIEMHNVNPDGSLGVVACPPDLNGDGMLDFFDVSAFLAAFNALDPVADFNRDGLFDFFDVSAFLAAFNAGCP